MDDLKAFRSFYLDKWLKDKTLLFILALIVFVAAASLAGTSITKSGIEHSCTVISSRASFGYGPSGEVLACHSNIYGIMRVHTEQVGHHEVGQLLKVMAYERPYWFNHVYTIIE